MFITLKRWLARNPAAPDVQSYRSTLTVATDTVTLAHTWPGKLTRRQALDALASKLVREGYQDTTLIRALWDAR